nr:hypothetical protein CFP56_28839 [Quercus suber]
MGTLSQAPLNADKPRITYGAVSSEVFSYPFLGGLVRKIITRVELDWLSLTDDPSATKKAQDSHDANTEDNLALDMMRLGGRWWPDRQLYERHQNAGYSYGHHYPPDLDIGYPHTGGVLVLRTSAGNSPYFDGLPATAPRKPDGWSRLSLCATMEERCDVLRKFGAIMYVSTEECQDIPKSLQEGITQVRSKVESDSKIEGYLTQAAILGLSITLPILATLLINLRLTLRPPSWVNYSRIVDKAQAGGCVFDALLRYQLLLQYSASGLDEHLRWGSCGSQHGTLAIPSLRRKANLMLIFSLRHVSVSIKQAVWLIVGIFSLRAYDTSCPNAYSSGTYVSFR